MPATDPLEGPRLRQRVQTELDAVIAHQREVLAELGEPVAQLVDEIADLLAGGKRLRAAFVYWGYRALGGPDSPALVRAAASIEMFQAAALLHDDVMDDSDLRRGRPTAHRSFATRHVSEGWEGGPDRFGQAAAILAGDLCLSWCDEMYAGSGLPVEQLQRARPTFDRMRTQLMAGQFLDVLEAAQGWEQQSHTERIARSRMIIRYKSAQYSVSQPLLIGAVAAGADEATADALGRYGLALGEAFQLRDDLLGVFGDPSETGKPAGDDLREGKRTALIAHGLDLAPVAESGWLLERLGAPDLTAEEVARARRLLTESGAVAATEAMIAEGARLAREALDGIPGLAEQGRQALARLVDVATARTT